MENSSNYFENNFCLYYPKRLFILSDGTLRTEDGCSFSIHRFVLAKNSNFFLSLFSNTGEKEILIPGIQGEDLSNILSYVYTGNIQVTENNILDLIVASHRLQLDDLLFKLKQHSRKCLSVTNSLSIFKVCLELNREDIARECFRFIQLHFESIVRCADSTISELPVDALKLLLRDKNLRVTRENIVWLSITKWVEADTKSRLAIVPDLLKHLAISDIDENMANEILQHDIVTKNPFCQEVYHGKSLISDADNLTTLQCYFQTHIRPTTTLFEHRQPSKLNVISQYVGTDGIQIYVTYDESIDLWRKLTDCHKSNILFPEILMPVNDCIYMFLSDENRILCYSLIQKQWKDLVGFRLQRTSYEVVKLDGSIYILGGFSDGNYDDVQVSEVEFYNSETGEWYFTTPMWPLSHFYAVTYNNTIFTFGYSETDLGDEMVVQTYDPTAEEWNLQPTPCASREDCALAVYRDMIYVIGSHFLHENSKVVEVFDPNTYKWSEEVNLPYAYSIPKAIVLDDKLIVYDNMECACDWDCSHRSPPVQWNIHQKCWETVESSYMNALHHYSFFTLENSECINILSCENRDPVTHFEYSPFS